MGPPAASANSETGKTKNRLLTWYRRSPLYVRILIALALGVPAGWA